VYHIARCHWSCDHLLSWIENFFTNRSQQIKVGNSLSNITNLSRGVVQGSVIERSPTVTNLVRGTKRISVSADDLSRRLESMSATRCSDDDRYGGARSWRQRKTNVATLKSTRSTILNQCSSIKADVTWSDHRRSKIDLAAALMTDFRQRNWSGSIALP